MYVFEYGLYLYILLTSYTNNYKANLRFLKFEPKDKRFSKERQFYIRCAANAKRSINQLILKGE